MAGTLSFRVVVVSAAMTTAIIAAAFTLSYISARQILQSETAEVVEAEFHGIVDDLEPGRGSAALVDAINARAETDSDAVYLLAAPNGQRIAGNLESWPPAARSNGWITVRLRRVSTGESVDVGARTYALPDGVRLLVGRDLRAQRSFLRAMSEAAGLALAASVLLAAASGFILNRLVMRRIGDIDQTARAIVEGDLSRRIPVRGGDDEFTHLAATLNAMLERIEALVLELRTVTDSLAHDLRTPLTRLKTQIERAADAELDAEARKDAIGMAEEESERVLSLLSAMTDIARAESGAGRTQFQRVDLTALARDMYDLHQPLAEDEGVDLSIEAEQGVALTGHPQFLAQLISNLIDNALKHGMWGAAPDGARRGAIKLRVYRDGDRAVLEVGDRGPGIPEEQRGVALSRFGRLDASRSTPGSGLGLALAATIARMHGGELNLLDNAPGLKVRVALPAG